MAKRKSITEVPFIMISRENAILMSKLNQEERYKILSAILEYFLLGKDHDFGNNRVLDFVWTALRETFNRKLDSYNNSIEAGQNNLDKVNEERKARKKKVDKETGEIINE